MPNLRPNQLSKDTAADILAEGKDTSYLLMSRDGIAIDTAISVEEFDKAIGRAVISSPAHGYTSADIGKPVSGATVFDDTDSTEWPSGIITAIASTDTLEVAFGSDVVEFADTLLEVGYDLAVDGPYVYWDLSEGTYVSSVPTDSQVGIQPVLYVLSVAGGTATARVIDWQNSPSSTATQTATGTFTIDPLLPSTSIDSSGGAVTATLGAGRYIGQTHTVVMTNATAASTLTVTNHDTVDGRVFSFAAVDETVILKWTGTEWTTLKDTTASGTGVINVKDFGATGDGVTDDSAAIQAAIDYAESVRDADSVFSIIVEFPRGVYKCTLPIVLPMGIQLVGESIRGSRLVWYPPASGQVFITLGDGSVQCRGIQLRRLGLYTTSSNATTMIKTVDVSNALVEDVWVQAENIPAGTDTVGLEVTGRENSSFNRLRIFAPTCIKMSNATGGIDNHNFHDLYLSAQPAPTLNKQACVWIDNTKPGAIAFTGRQAWALNKYGLYWETTSSSLMRNALFENIRTEQPQGGASDYTFYIKMGTDRTHNSYYQNLVFKNCHAQETQSGWYIRGIRNVVLQGCSHNGGGANTPIDFARCQEVVIDGCDFRGQFWTQEMKCLWSTFNYDGTNTTAPHSSRWCDTAIVFPSSDQLSTEAGRGKWSRNTYIANNGSQLVPLNKSKGIRFARVRVTALASDGSAWCDGEFILANYGLNTASGTRGCKLISGTANVSDEPNTATSLNLYSTSDVTNPLTTVYIQNKLGVAARVIMEADVDYRGPFTTDWPVAAPWTTAEVVQRNDQRMNTTGDIYRAAADGTCGATEPTHTEGIASDGGVNWVFQGNPN